MAHRRMIRLVGGSQCLRLHGLEINRSPPLGFGWQRHVEVRSADESMDVQSPSHCLRQRSVNVEPDRRYLVGDTATRIGIRLWRLKQSTGQSGGGLRRRRIQPRIPGRPSTCPRPAVGPKKRHKAGSEGFDMPDRGAKVDSPGMGTRSDREHMLHRRIGNVWGGKIMTEEGTSSYPLSHSSKDSGHLAPPFLQIQVSQDSRNSLLQKNINDILEQREWEVRNVGNWLDGEGKEFFKDYNDLSLPPTKGPQL